MSNLLEQAVTKAGLKEHGARSEYILGDPSNGVYLIDNTHNCISMQLEKAPTMPLDHIIKSILSIRKKELQFLAVDLRPVDDPEEDEEHHTYDLTSRRYYDTYTKRYLDNITANNYSKYVFSKNLYLFIRDQPIPYTPYPHHTYHNVNIGIIPYTHGAYLWKNDHEVTFVFDPKREGIYAFIKPPIIVDTDDEIIELTFQDPEAPKLKKEHEVRLNKIEMYSKDMPTRRTFDNHKVRHAFKIPTHPNVYKYPAYQRELAHLYNFGQELMMYVGQW